MTVGQLVGGEALDEATARAELESAGEVLGLSSREVARTVEIGLTAGQKFPRTLDVPKVRELLRS